jgi:hypothetical protein
MIEDYLVYELVKPTYSQVGFTIDPNDVMTRYPTFVFKPLFGFYGLEEDCRVEVDLYIEKIQEYTRAPNVLTIYQLSCLDPAVTETYVGKTSDAPEERMKGHELDSQVNKTKVHAFMREHGSCLNWKMTILGQYWSVIWSEHSDRLEWFWWKKKGSQLNTVRPGIGVVTRDMRKLRMTETAMLAAYEVLEERLSVAYTGSEPVPDFSKNVVVNLDGPQPIEKTYERFKLNKTVSFHRDMDYYGTMFILKNPLVKETYLGFAQTYSHPTFPHIVQLFMGFNGGRKAWSRERLCDCCRSEYVKLKNSYALNSMSREQLVQCGGKGTVIEESRAV